MVGGMGCVVIKFVIGKFLMFVLLVVFEIILVKI